MKRHNSLQRTLKKIWDMPVKVISVVVGALGATPIKLKQWLSDIGIIDTENTVLYSARIVWNILGIWGVLLTQNLKKFNHWSKTYSVCNSNIIIIVIIIIMKISPRPGNTGMMSSKGYLISWEEGFSLALVGNSSRDGVSIKILVWRYLKPNLQLLWVHYV